MAAARYRSDPSRTMLLAALVLALWFFAERPAEAQKEAAKGRTIAGAVVPPTDLIGPWLRNEERSEDPNLTAESMGPRPEQVPAFVRELAESLNDRRDAVLIEVDGKTLLILNARGELSSFRLGNKQYLDRPGNELNLLTTSATLRIETRISGWVWIETFSRQDDQLVRVTEIRSVGLPGLQFRTVYDPVGSEHPSAAPAGAGAEAVSQPILIVPPGRRRRELLSGRVEVQTLIAEPTVSSVEFTVDGDRTKVVRKPPFKARIELAEPPREQTLEVRAYNAEGKYLGGDRIALNRIDAPFAVHIARIRSEHTKGNTAVRVKAGISVPRSAALERVEFYRSDRLVVAVDDFGDVDIGSARLVPVEALIGDVRSNDFVRVAAKLADGRELEDAELLQGADYQGEIDVQLVQLQVLVTDREGNPVGGLEPDDFSVRENGQPREVENIHTAHDVPLVLGLAIDSSDSMLPIWRKLKHVVASFLDSSLASGDRAFLVDFDKTVRLLQPLTGNKPLVSRWLDRLTPMGGTALNDGMLFSLLQYRNEPGRRALVVVTDGADLHSRSRPKQSADFAERLGVPIYFVELDNLITEVSAGGGGMASSKGGSRLWQQKARKRLDRISRQTGGRLFHIPPFAEGADRTERIEQVFDQIEDDLRNQHVLTYYSDLPPSAAIEPEVKLTRRGLKLRSAVPLEAIE